MTHHPKHPILIASRRNAMSAIAQLGRANFCPDALVHFEAGLRLLERDMKAQGIPIKPRELPVKVGGLIPMK